MTTTDSPLHGARVLVTGGAGFIGTAVRDALRRAGARPVLLDNLSAYEPATVALLGTGRHDPDLVFGDASDNDLVRHLVHDADFVVHAAAHSTVQGCLADPDTAFRSNLAATDTLVRAVADSPSIRRLILLSTAQVYGHGDPDTDTTRPRLFTETQPYQPLNPYASAKLWAELHTRQLLTAAGRDFTLLRPFSVYGPGQVPKPGAASWVVAQFTMYAALGQELLLNGGGRQVRDFVFRDDAADAIVRALTAPGAAGRTLNLGTGVQTSVSEVAEHVLAHFPGTTVRTAPPAAGDPLGGRADTALMHRVLDWAPAVTVTEGIARYVDWVRSTPAAIPPWMRAETSDGRLAAWTAPGPAVTRPPYLDQPASSCNGAS
ncbi:NAD-dependent epimerase/dehydratase family protein [Kitasatospora sp. NPDC093102]|uniref:NAD-dependent epimerase/dehydratase family protein n=1 Tax=Kitasatospora sp. NPDC093102 TaxID=3155069 RepID=UPI0034442A17